MSKKSRMHLMPEARKEVAAAHRQFSHAKALFYNGWLGEDQLPQMHQWRQSNTFDIKEIAQAVAPYQHFLLRTFTTVRLHVNIGEAEVCFNCLEPFSPQDPKGGATWHHLLPWRFRGLPHYNTHVPVVRAHRICTDDWHERYDPCYHWIEDAAIWQVDKYLQIARDVLFGFAMHAAEDQQRNPELRISKSLLPFILGIATISYVHPKEPNRLVNLGDTTEIAKALGLPSIINLPVAALMPHWYVTA